MYLVGIISFVVALAASWAVTPLVIRLAHALGAVDVPGGRKIHASPIPRIGGVGVFFGFVSGLVIAAYLTGHGLDFSGVSIYWRGVILAAIGMLIVGLVDDVWGLCFRWKFAAQIVAATYIWSCGFQIDNLTHPFGGVLQLGILSLPLTVLWIVGITNAVNLIDGLDGLATGVALITTSSVAVIALVRSELGTAAASVGLAGSLVGFLRYNFSPARIFLGDSGSMFLGFVLAVTAVRGSQKGTTAVALLVPLLVLGLPVLDTGLAVVRRLYRLGNRGVRSPNVAGYMIRNISEVFLPDRGHIHHRLLELGMSHRRAVGVLYSVGLLFALCAFCLVLLRGAWLALLLVGILGGLMAAFFALLYLRVWRQQAERPSDAGPYARPHATEALAASPGESQSS